MDLSSLLDQLWSADSTIDQRTAAANSLRSHFANGGTWPDSEHGNTVDHHRRISRYATA